MQNLFNPHPYSTVVGTLIERATDSGQTSEDWSLILEICDTINETDEGPKDAIRAMRKRITSSAGKDHIAIWYTLVLLEACVKNCGRRFHSQVANKEFLHDFLKLLSPKNEPSQQMQTKILSMIKIWVDCAWDVPGRRDLEKVYAGLRQRGIQFPSHPTLNEVGRYRTNSNETLFVRPSSALVHSSKLQAQGRDPRKYLIAESHHAISAQRPAVELHTECSQRTNLHSCQTCHIHHHHHHQTSNPVISSTSGTCRSNSGTLSIHSQNVAPNIHSTQRPVLQATHVRSNRLVDMEQQLVPVHRLSHERRCNITFPTHVSIEQMEFDLDGTVRHLTSSQRIRLTQDLAVVETNVNVLNDMLAELRPDSVNPDDLNLLQELYQTCRAMHRRVVEFLSQVSDEEATPCLLQVNDNLNNAFSRYERFERYRIRALRSEVMSEAAALDLASVRFNTTQPSRTFQLAARPHNAPNPMLAITAGRTNTRQVDLTGNRMTSYNNTNIGLTDSNLVDGQLPNGTQARYHFTPDGDDDDDEDDDDSLIDISGPPSQSQACCLRTTDYMNRRVNNRQLVPVPQPTSNRNTFTERPIGTGQTLEDDAVEAINSLALVPATQALQTRPSALEMQCAIRKPANRTPETTRTSNPLHSGDLVQF